MTQPTRTAIFAGSFDPPTFGHLNIIERALKIFDHLIVAVASDISKSSLLTVAERLEILSEIIPSDPRIQIDSFRGLLVDYAKKKGVHILVRGIRTVADYEYELQMSLANRMLNPNVETVFIMTEGRYSHISSSIIKQVISLGGSGKEMVPSCGEARLKEILLKSPL